MFRGTFAALRSPPPPFSSSSGFSHPTCNTKPPLLPQPPGAVTASSPMCFLAHVLPSPCAHPTPPPVCRHDYKAETNTRPAGLLQLPLPPHPLSTSGGTDTAPTRPHLARRLQKVNTALLWLQALRRPGQAPSNSSVADRPRHSRTAEARPTHSRWRACTARWSAASTLSVWRGALRQRSPNSMAATGAGAWHQLLPVGECRNACWYVRLHRYDLLAERCADTISGLPVICWAWELFEAGSMHRPV